jgi:type IV pilus assembly protein PilX
MKSPYLATHRHPHARQRGAALVVGLLLLVIITLLAVTGMTTANTELIMAGNEQQRQNSFRAAETGVDVAVRNVETVGTTPGLCVRTGPTAVFASGTDRYSTGSMYVGSGGLIPGWGVNSGEAFFYAITSAGAGARGARTNLAQGVVKIQATGVGGSGGTFTALPTSVPECEPNDLE